jgi:hypothetical protein
MGSANIMFVEDMDGSYLAVALPQFRDTRFIRATQDFRMYCTKRSFN